MDTIIFFEDEGSNIRNNYSKSVFHKLRCFGDKYDPKIKTAIKVGIISVFLMLCVVVVIMMIIYLDQGGCCK